MSITDIQDSEDTMPISNGLKTLATTPASSTISTSIPNPNSPKPTSNVGVTTIPPIIKQPKIVIHDSDKKMPVVSATTAMLSPTNCSSRVEKLQKIRDVTLPTLKQTRILVTNIHDSEDSVTVVASPTRYSRQEKLQRLREGATPPKVKKQPKILAIDMCDEDQKSTASGSTVSTTIIVPSAKNCSLKTEELQKIHESAIPLIAEQPENFATDIQGSAETTFVASGITITTPITSLILKTSPNRTSRSEKLQKARAAAAPSTENLAKIHAPDIHDSEDITVASGSTINTPISCLSPSSSLTHISRREKLRQKKKHYSRGRKAIHNN